MGKNRQQQSNTQQQPAADTATEQTNQEQLNQDTGADGTDAPSIAGSELTGLETGTSNEQDSGAAAGDAAAGGEAAEKPAEEKPTEAPTPAPTQAPTEAPTPAPTPEPTKAPVPAPTPVATPQTTITTNGKNTVIVSGDTPVSGVVKAMIEKAAAEATTGGAIVLRTIGDYMENMKPKKPISHTDGARHQVSLYRALMKAINNLDDDFALVFTTILRLFNEHRDGVFHDAYVFRFMESVSLPVQDRQAFQRVLNLLKAAADPSTRAAALKQTDFEKTMEHGFTDQGRQNILTYFQK
jgi:hypothetical protein